MLLGIFIFVQSLSNTPNTLPSSSAVILGKPYTKCSLIKISRPSSVLRKAKKSTSGYISSIPDAFFNLISDKINSPPESWFQVYNVVVPIPM